MRSILTLIFLIGMVYEASSAQAAGKEKIIYKYKQYEKFDFEDLDIESDKSSYGDLSITPRYQREFKNKLPYRLNFNPEMRMSLEKVQ